MPTAALALAVLFHAAPLQTESQKIEALIKHLESLTDAKFIRNGVEYDARSAGQFLRGKRQANQSSIKTAQDFIDKIASQSSTTGKPYLIKLKGGAETKSRDYLTAELKKLETADK